MVTYFPSQYRSPSGAVVAHYEFDAWGAQLGSSAPFSGGFSYGYVGGLGVRTDAATGLIWMRHRWFDSSLGRFVSRDPLRAKSNRYKYAFDNPCSYIDPSGLQPPDSVMDKRVGINLPPEAYPPPPTHEQMVDGLIIGASIVFEPVDWVMTGYEAATEGFNWWMAAGLIPIGSYAAFKRIQKWFDLDLNVKLTHDDIPCSQDAYDLYFTRRPFIPDEWYPRITDDLAPMQRGPYSTWDRYTPSGNLHQVTTYDKYGERMTVRPGSSSQTWRRGAYV